MAVSTIGVADATSPDKYLHTHSRTISSTAREDQYVQQGESAYPTYAVRGTGLALDTNTDHILQVMGDGSNVSRLKRIFIQGISATAATLAYVSLIRLSTAGTGGSSATINPYDTSDTYAGAARQGVSTSKGTEGASLLQFRVYCPTSGNLAATVVWEARPDMKPIIFGTSTANGIAIKNGLAVTGGTIDLTLEFTTTSYL